MNIVFEVVVDNKYFAKILQKRVSLVATQINHDRRVSRTEMAIA